MALFRLRSRISVYFTLTIVVLISTFLVWLPFALHTQNWFGIPIADSNFAYVYRHFDGPLYIITAKSFYDPQIIQSLKIELPLSPAYFAAHFPLYPGLIRFFVPLFGYLKSMLFVNILFSVLLACFFYKFLSDFKVAKPLLLAIIFLFLPRFLVVRSVGAPESLFLFLTLLSLYFFEKKNFLWSGLFGALSALARSSGILLFLIYALVFLEQFLKRKKVEAQWFFILIIPLGLFAVFSIYAKQYGDFFTYFKSGDNIHLMYPFAVFNHAAAWVSTAWLEDIFFYLFFYLLAVIKLKESPHRSFFYFSLVYFGAILFIQHRDIARYSLPLWPLALIAFEDFFTSKKFQLAFLILLFGIYLYAWNFMSQNVMPISDWSAYL